MNCCARPDRKNKKIVLQTKKERFKLLVHEENINTMKTIRQKINAMTLVAIAALLIVSCSPLTPGADPLVVRAEQVTQLAFTTFDTFLGFELDHRAEMSKDVTAAADSIRRLGKPVIETARAMTRAYKTNRTEDNKLALSGTIAVLEAMMLNAQHLNLAVQQEFAARAFAKPKPDIEAPPK